MFPQWVDLGSRAKMHCGISKDQNTTCARSADATLIINTVTNSCESQLSNGVLILGGESANLSSC